MNISLKMRFLIPMVILVAVGMGASIAVSYYKSKNALVEASGDMDAAAEALRKSGLAKADKKAGRVAAEGVIVVEVSNDGKTAVVVEVNSETDFVAQKDEFRAFATAVANA